ncbi:MAG: hypothetical protein ABII74_06490 [Elusimicrobiota bacterium]
MQVFLLICLLFVCSMNVFAQDKENIYGGSAVMQEPAKPSGMRGAATDLPDISVVGEIVGKACNIEGDIDKNKLNMRNVEFAYQGYIYPSMRANVILAFHKHEGNIESDIEEANVVFTNLFNAFSLKAGKMLGNFGIVNGFHPHHRPFVDQPDVHKSFLGDHGLMLEGAALNYLLPLPFFAEIEAGWGQTPAGHHHSTEEAQTADVLDTSGNTRTVDLHQEHEHTEFSLADRVSTGRLKLSFPLGRDSELISGISYAKGKGAHYLEHKDETQVSGVDLTFKLFPSAFSKFVWQNEYFILNRAVPIGTIKRNGFYSYLGYKANQYWSFGARYDRTQDAFPHPDAAGLTNVDVSQATKAQSIIVTRNLTETTYLRGQYKCYTEPEGRFEAFLQMSFGIGPHSHPLE